MDFPIHNDTITMGLPILYFKGSQVEVSKLWCISVPEGCKNLLNSADPDEMQHHAVCQSTHLGASIIQSVKIKRNISLKSENVGKVWYVLKHEDCTSYSWLTLHQLFLAYLAPANPGPLASGKAWLLPSKWCYTDFNTWWFVVRLKGVFKIQVKAKYMFNHYE